MNKILIIWVALVFLFASCGGKDGASVDFDASKLIYTEIHGGSQYEVTSAGFERGDTLNIPSEYNGKPVTVIGDGAFSGLHFKNVVIPDSVTHIGKEAFSSCGDLESVETSAVSIGAEAFWGCEKELEKKHQVTLELYKTTGSIF